MVGWFTRHPGGFGWGLYPPAARKCGAYHLTGNGVVHVCIEAVASHLAAVHYSTCFQVHQFYDGGATAVTI